MIKFRWGHCQQKLGVPNEYAGRRVRCNKCNQSSVVPKPVVTQAPATDVASSASVYKASTAGASSSANLSQGSRASVERQASPQPEPDILDNIGDCSVNTGIF